MSTSAALTSKRPALPAFSTMDASPEDGQENFWERKPSLRAYDVDSWCRSSKAVWFRVSITTSPVRYGEDVSTHRSTAL